MAELLVLGGCLHGVGGSQPRIAPEMDEQVMVRMVSMIGGWLAGCAKRMEIVGSASLPADFLRAGLGQNSHLSHAYWQDWGQTPQVLELQHILHWTHFQLMLSHDPSREFQGQNF